MERKENNGLTRKQIITIIVCLVIIACVCIFLIKENKKLVKEHPEYSVEGVSSKRRAGAEELFNKVLANGGEKIDKDKTIYKLNGVNFRSNILYGNTSLENKLLVALENTKKSVTSNIPDDIKTNYFNGDLVYGDTEVSNIQVEVISFSDLNNTYKDMFGSDITAYLSVNGTDIKYICDNQNKVYYLKHNGYDNMSGITYYIYYNGYNSPYEHHDVATVNVSVIGVLNENSDLYKVTNVYGDVIKEHLTKNELDEFVSDENNYSLVSSYQVNYKFDNDSSYGLTFDVVK